MQEDRSGNEEDEDVAGADEMEDEDNYSEEATVAI